LLGSCFLASRTKCLQALIWLLISLPLSTYNPTSFLLSPTSSTHPLFARILHLDTLGLTTRTRCYTIWYLAEGALILSGIAFSGDDLATNTPLWNRMHNVNPFLIEFARNPNTALANWNVLTAQWLKQYVYLRLVRRGERPGFAAVVVALLFSTVWVSFYPGYYEMFVCGCLCMLQRVRLRL